MLSKTILIAEDDTHLLSLLSDKLKHEVSHVLETKDGEEALKTALTHHPDLVLLDIKMPKKDGLAVLS
jgi:DNA-binding response OmpR family regulator